MKQQTCKQQLLKHKPIGLCLKAYACSVLSPMFFSAAVTVGAVSYISTLSLMAAEPESFLSYEIEQQLVAVEVQAHLRNVRQDIAAQNFRSAQKHLEEIDVLLNSVSYVALSKESASKIVSPETLKEIQALTHRVEKLLLNKAVADGSADRLDRRDAHEQRMYGEIQDSVSVMEDRLARITALRQRGLYEVAMERARHLVLDYPQDKLVEKVYALTLREVHQQRRLNHEESLYELKQEMRNRMMSSLIPTGFHGKPMYPENWRIETKKRGSSRGVGNEVLDFPLWHQRLQNSLAQRVSISFEGMTPDECADLLHKQTGLNIVVANDVIADNDTPISLHARNMRVDHVLDWIVEQSDLKWQLWKEALYISTEQHGESIVRTYDVGQVLYQAPDLPGPEMGSSLDPSDLAFDPFAGEESEDALAPEDLVDFIQGSVAPDSWGDGSEIVIQGSQLTVVAPRETHLLMQTFLQQMQGNNEVVVHVQSNWVRISDIFLEEIGFNWSDTNLPTIGFKAGHGYYSEGDGTWSASASTKHFLPATPGMIGARALESRGLELQTGLLSGTQLQGIFNAQHRRERVQSLDGIDLNVRNGARANSFFGNQVAYISDYDVVVGGSSAYDPNVSVLSYGSVLDVKPYVSADRKYVTMNMKSVTSNVNFTQARLVAATTVNGGGNTFLTANLVFPFELPVIDIEQIQTTAMIPDGGSLLTGGFNRGLEDFQKTQVPVLGNIPVLGRLFGRRAKYQGKQQLYLMTKVDIIIYSEMEMTL